MRRIFSLLLPALLVVLAQQLALVHEIGHGVGDWSGKEIAAAHKAASSDGGGADKVGYCDKCFQYAQVANALGACAQVPNIGFGQSDAACAREPASLAADVPLSRSRGPPAIL